MFFNEIQKRLINNYSKKIQDHLNSIILADLQEENSIEFCRCLSSLYYLNKTMENWEIQDVRLNY